MRGRRLRGRRVWRREQRVWEDLREALAPPPLSGALTADAQHETASRWGERVSRLAAATAATGHSVREAGAKGPERRHSCVRGPRRMWMGRKGMGQMLTEVVRSPSRLHHHPLSSSTLLLTRRRPREPSSGALAALTPRHGARAATVSQAKTASAGKAMRRSDQPPLRCFVDAAEAAAQAAVAADAASSSQRDWHTARCRHLRAWRHDSVTLCRWPPWRTAAAGARQSRVPSQHRPVVPLEAAGRSRGHRLRPDPHRLPAVAAIAAARLQSHHLQW